MHIYLHAYDQQQCSFSLKKTIIHLLLSRIVISPPPPSNYTIFQNFLRGACPIGTPVETEKLHLISLFSYNTTQTLKKTLSGQNSHQSASFIKVLVCRVSQGAQL